MLRAELLIRHAVALLQVGAAAESSLASPRQNCATILRWVNFQCPKDLNQFNAHRRTDCVRYFGTVQPNDENLSVDFFQRQRTDGGGVEMLSYLQRHS